MKGPYLALADFYAVIGSAFLLIMMLVLQAANIEVITHLQNQARTNKPSDPASPDVRKSARLDVIYGTKAPSFVLALPGQPPQRFSDYQDVRAALRAVRPADLRLRADRRVESGVTQDITLDAAEIGTRLWQANERK